MTDQGMVDAIRADVATLNEKLKDAVVKNGLRVELSIEECANWIGVSEHTSIPELSVQISKVL